MELQIQEDKRNNIVTVKGLSEHIVAGMGEVLKTHLLAHDNSSAVTVTNLADTLAKIDVQGPLSAKIIGVLLKDPGPVFSGFPYFSFKGWFEKGDLASVLLKDETPILLSRTGYTGEFGFEIFLESKYLVKVWQMLQDQAGDDLMPCGLAARDSLRAGAVLPLSHQDIGDWPFSNNPWPFALPLGDDGRFTKSFIGSTALQHTEDSHYTYPFAGYDPRKIPITEDSGVLDEADRRTGEILTCTTDMAIGRVDDKIVSTATSEQDGKPKDFRPKGLSCGFVKVNRKLDFGESVVLTDGKRKVKVEIRSDVRPDRTARLPMHKMI